MCCYIALCVLLAGCLFLIGHCSQPEIVLAVCDLLGSYMLASLAELSKWVDDAHSLVKIRAQ